jgi:hypothetical protein
VRIEDAAEELAVLRVEGDRAEVQSRRRAHASGGVRVECRGASVTRHRAR